MKLLIAGLATGLFLAGTPVWADSWKNESGHGWREIHWEQPRRHAENRWERQERRWERHHRQRERFARRWERRYEHFNDRYYYAPPVTRHHYYYRDYSYR
jgi:hypothetical protein